MDVRGCNIDDQTSSSSSATGQVIRSYKCDFCRRGFASAQALGGHMNIHRKDRAKLRQSISNDNDDDNEISLSLDTKNIVNPAHHQLFPKNLHLHHRHKSDENFTSFSEYVELPFFGQAREEDHDDDEEKKKMMRILDHKEGSSSSSSSQKEALDLELRLGLDPYHKERSNIQR